ncbi:hypothetical protein Landi51_07473 [Colletotrichum acutatum]
MRADPHFALYVPVGRPRSFAQFCRIFTVSSSFCPFFQRVHHHFCYADLVACCAAKHPLLALHRSPGGPPEISHGYGSSVCPLRFFVDDRAAHSISSPRGPWTGARGGIGLSLDSESGLYVWGPGSAQVLKDPGASPVIDFPRCGWPSPRLGLLLTWKPVGDVQGPQDYESDSNTDDKREVVDQEKKEKQC